MLNNLNSKPRPQNSSTNSNSAEIATDYSDRIANEYLYCQNCTSLKSCQYTPLGNTGFRPVWNRWSPTYSFVKECNHKQAQNTQARIDRLFGSSGIPLIFKTTALSTLPITKAYVTLLNFTAGNISGVYLIGSPNSGKTKLVSATGNELILQGIDTIYITAASMLTQLRANNPDYYGRLKILTTIPALIIEDLKPQNSYNEEQLELIVEERTRAGLKLIITSESRPEALTKTSSLIQRLNRLRRANI